MDAPRSPKKRAASPECAAMITTGDSSPSSSASLSSSVTDFAFPHSPVSSSASPGPVAVVMRTQRELANSTGPLNQRYSRAINVAPYYTWANAGSAASASASETTLIGQHQLRSNENFWGLTALKEWVRYNVHNILVPPSEFARVCNRQTPPNAMCVCKSTDGTGIRSYLQSVCAELRIDLYSMRGTVFEEEMFPDLLANARQSGRAMILFDRTQWFTHREYAQRGAVFMHYLLATIDEELTRRRFQAMGTAIATLDVENALQRNTLATALPGLWIVFSCTGTDVVNELIERVRGCHYQWRQASRAMAREVARRKIIRATGHLDIAEVERELSETPYTRTLDEIAALLQDYETGPIVEVMEMAMQLALQRSTNQPVFDRSPRHFMPTLPEVQQALRQMNGQAFGGVTAVSTAPVATAHATAAAINASYARR